MFIRKIQLKIGDESGEGLDFSGLHIVFSVSKKDSITPNAAQITIYNVAQSTIARVQKEFSQVFLSAGYDENFAVIFNGTIKNTTFSRENGTDGALTIVAGDGDVAHNFAVVNKTLSAGATQKDIISTAVDEYSKKGVVSGYTTDIATPALPRGKVMFGMARDYLQNGAKNANVSFSVQDGKMQIIDEKGALPNEVFVLNSGTGLIGSPIQTTDGVQAVCLLNPRLKIGAVVQIAQADIVQSLEENVAALASDGYYRVYSLDFTGDTHGNDWYSTFTGVLMDSTSGKTVD